MPKSLVVPFLMLASFAGPLVAPALARDGDGDGLPDSWERRHHLSTKHPSAKGDPDRDGLSNRREHRARTNPHRADTDRDGFKDGVELRAGTNPRKRGSHPRRKKPRPNRPSESFPTPSSTGVPGNWTPKETRTSDLRITRPGAVVEDLLLVDADIVVDAPNVTIRRVKLQGGWIRNLQGGTCNNGLTVADTTLEPPPGQDSTAESEGVVSYGGYTARRVKIWRRAEGFRVGGKPDCGPVRIEDSFVKIVIPDGRCDLHADGIQGYGGNVLSVANVTIDFIEPDCGTAPFFMPKDQGNTSASVDRLLVMGGGYPFRMGVPGSVSGLRIVDRTWSYEPTNVACSQISAWDAKVVRIDANYQVTRTLRSLPCRQEEGG